MTPPSLPVVAVPFAHSGHLSPGAALIRRGAHAGIRSTAAQMMLIAADTATASVTPA
jgi:hypothetical protein